MSKAIEDIRWVASKVNDLAILLRVHGFGTLADKLDAVRKALRSKLTANSAGAGHRAIQAAKRKAEPRRRPEGVIDSSV
jgi:hypothetical protein